MLEFLVLFLTIYFFSSPIGISYVLGHIWTSVISLSSLKELSKYYIFWFLLLAVYLTASERRFSIEYLFLALGCFTVGISSKGSNHLENKTKARNILLFIFLFLSLANLFKIEPFEKGSLLMFIPLYLALYFEKLNKKNFLIYVFFGSVLFFSNKITALLAFVFCLRRKLLSYISVIIIILYFLIRQDLSLFIAKSIEPRIYIWKAIIRGFLNKPIFGHGFGTFALDFPQYRIHSDVLGGRVSEQIVHGHNLFVHYLFELGIIGIFLSLVFVYLIYLNCKEALLPLLIISLFDIPLVSFNQFLLIGVIISPFINHLGIVHVLFQTIQNISIRRLAYVISVLISLFIFIPSILGHHFYDNKRLDAAIKWDNRNSLYYFVRGAKNLNMNPLLSEKDLNKAIEISPSVSYFYGFLGASQLANNKVKAARSTLEKAFKYDGYDGYWCILYAYINLNNRRLFEKYEKLAFDGNPEIKDILSGQNLRSRQCIGVSNHTDIRINGFYRRGEKIFYPVPNLTQLKKFNLQLNHAVGTNSGM